MSSDAGKGPFYATPHPYLTEAVPGDHVLAILDDGGSPFAYVAVADCVGGDLSAAKARATRIAEALNQREGQAKPAPYIDDAGNLCAPAGFCFVASGNTGVEMVPLLNVVMAPGK